MQIISALTSSIVQSIPPRENERCVFGTFLRAVAFTLFIVVFEISSALAAEPGRAVINIGPGVIPGTSTIPGFENLIVVNDFSFGVSQAGLWETDEIPQPPITTFTDLEFRKLMDQASPELAFASATKTQYPQAILTVFDPQNVIIMTITLDKVIVTSVGIKQKPGETRPLETVTLSFLKSTWQVGTSVASWNLETASQALTDTSQTSGLTAPTGTSALLDTTVESGSTLPSAAPAGNKKGRAPRATRKP